MRATERTEAQRAAATPHYEVVAVRYATLRTHRRELFYRYETYGEPDAEVEMAYYFWLLRGHGQVILVDTGFDPATGARRGRTCLCPPVEVIRRLGIEPQSVSTIVVTHFHYDHIGNLAAFPEAEIIVPKPELDFWAEPISRHFHFGSHVEAREIAFIEDARRSGRVRLTDGTEEIIHGVTAVNVGGHSPGQQITIVATRDGDLVLASDAVHMYEELELERPFAVIADLERMYEAYDVLKELATSRGAIVVPGHDPGVVDRFPAVANSGGLAVQLA